MTDHYSGNDPETGCGIMIFVALGVVLAVSAVVLAWLLPLIISTIQGWQP